MPSSTDFLVRQLLRQFVNEAEKRETDGLTVYGDFNPATDKRVLSHEAIEEVEDCYVYLKFLGQKHPTLKLQAGKAQAVAGRLYLLLRVLERKEEQLTAEKGGTP